jgi:hypothetical protein
MAFFWLPQGNTVFRSNVNLALGKFDRLLVSTSPCKLWEGFVHAVLHNQHAQSIIKLLSIFDLIGFFGFAASTFGFARTQ